MRIGFLMPLIITIGFTFCVNSNIDEITLSDNEVGSQVGSQVDFETQMGVYAALLNDKNKNLVELISSLPSGSNVKEEILDSIKVRFQGIVQKVSDAKTVKEVITFAYITPIDELLDLKKDETKDFKGVLSSAFSNGSINDHAIEEAKELIKAHLCKYNTKEDIKEVFNTLETINIRLSSNAEDPKIENLINEKLNEVTASIQITIDKILPIVNLRREASDFFGDALRYVALSTYVKENYIRDDNFSLASIITSTLTEMYAEYIKTPKRSEEYRQGLIYDIKGIYDLFVDVAFNFPQKQNSISIENLSKKFLREQIDFLKTKVREVDSSNTFGLNQKIVL